jgi:hypothetical protein
VEACPVDEISGEAQAAVYGRFESVTKPDGVFVSVDATSLSACEKACDLSQAVRSEVCKVFYFSEDDESCRLGSEAIGNFQDLVESPGSSLYERTCLPESSVEGLDSVWAMVPGRILVGHVQAVETVSTLRDCQLACLAADFECRSGMFYPADSTENCLLNSENKEGNEKLFVEESLADGMVYFEPRLSSKNEAIRLSRFRFNRIFRDMKEDPVGDKWTEWSKCVHGYKHRFFKCSQEDVQNCPKQMLLCPNAEVSHDGDWGEYSDVECRAVRVLKDRKRCAYGLIRVDGKLATCPFPVDCNISRTPTLT